MATVQPDDNGRGQPAIRTVHYQIPAQPTGVPSSAGVAASSGQPFMIDINSVEIDGATDDGSIPPQADPSRQQNISVGAVLPSLKSLLKPLEGSLPFLLIVLTKVLYDHRLGILVFLAMFGTFFHANSSLRRIILQREMLQQAPAEPVGSLIWLIVFLCGNIFCVYYVFDDQKLYRSLYLVCPEVDRVTLWVLLWITGMTDFIVKFATIIIKALVAILPRQILSLKRKGRWYMLIEILSQSYRSVLPITPWFYFLFDDEDTGQWFSLILLAIFVVCKGYNLLLMWRELRNAFAKFRVNTAFGTLPTRSQLESYDNCCPICQDKFTDPVSLSCSHVFCEDCAATWFNREKTCPLCRANISQTPQWRDGATCSSLQLY